MVTGSTAGIGLEIAQSLAAEGASIWINGRPQERVAALKQVQGDVQGVIADLSTAAGSEALYARVSDIDIFVNKLGIFETSPSCKSKMKTGCASFRRMLSGVRVTRHYLPGMLERKWGHAASYIKECS